MCGIRIYLKSSTYKIVSSIKNLIKILTADSCKIILQVETMKSTKALKYNQFHRFFRPLVFSLAAAARLSFFILRSTTLNLPLTPAGRRTRLLAKCLRVTT